VYRPFWVVFVFCLFLGFDVFYRLRKKRRRRSRRRRRGVLRCESGKTGRGFTASSSCWLLVALVVVVVVGVVVVLRWWWLVVAMRRKWRCLFAAE
jgi:amino acid transporter